MSALRMTQVQGSPPEPDIAYQNSPSALGVSELSCGQEFAGVYQIKRALGGGGMGRVYEVVHKYLEKPMALKVFQSASGSVSNSEFQRTLKEARALSRLSHRNIVKVYDVATDGKCAYFSMELVKGESLETLLSKLGSLSPPLAFQIFGQLMEALDYAHNRGVIHRDIKPGNIMIVWQSDGSAKVKLVDFGIASFYGEATNSISLTRSGEVLGSPLYMSPEQAVGQKVDKRTDIYSCGLVLYEMLTGQRIFQGESAMLTLGMHISEDPVPILLEKFGDDSPAAKVIAGCLEKERDRRYHMAGEVLDDLNYLELYPFRYQGAILRSKKSPRASQNKIEARQLYTGSQSPGRTMPWAILACFFLVIAGLSLGLIFYATRDSKIGAGKLATVPSTLAVKQGEFVPDEQRKNSDEMAKLDAYLSSTAPFSRLEKRDGRLCRVFNFDRDNSIGFIINGSGMPTDAVGDLIYAADEELTFVPFTSISRYPNLFRRFRSDDFVAVEIRRNLSVNSETLSHLTHMKKLRRLVLESTDVRNDLSETFDQLPALDDLTISGSRVEPEALGKWRGVSKLKQLRYSAAATTASLLNAIKSAENLESLSIYGLEINASDLKTLTKFKKLQRLKFTEPDLTAADLAVLTALPELQTLRVNGCVVGPIFEPVIAKFKKLRYMEAPFAYWTYVDFAKLKNDRKGKPALNLRETRVVDLEDGLASEFE